MANLISPESYKLKIVEMFLLDQAQSDQHRKLFEPQWYDNWAGYMNEKGPEKLPNTYWTKRSRVPDEFRMIETIVPQHMLNMFRSQQWFSVESRSGPGEFYEQLVKNLLMIGWRRSDMFRKTLEGVKYSLITGHAVMKTYWEVEVGDAEFVGFDPKRADYRGDDFGKGIQRETRQKLQYYGPQTYFVDLFSYWEDPTGRQAYAIEKMHGLSLGRLKYMNTQYKGALYDTRELAKIQVGKVFGGTNNAAKMGFSGPSTPNSPFDTSDLVEYVEGIPKQRDRDGVDVFQYWKWVHPDVKAYDDTQWRLFIIVNRGHVIRDVAAPTPNRKPPYYHVKAVPVPGRFYGASVLDWTGELVELRNFWEDARREDAIQKLWQPLIINEHASMSPDDLFRRPGGVLWVGNHTGKLSDSVMLMPQRDVFNSAYQEPQIKEDQMNRASGATDPFGGQPAGGRTTATEASIVAQLGAGRFQLSTMWYDESLKLQCLKRMFELYQSRMEQPEIIELGGTVRKRFPMDMRDLLWDIDVLVDSGALGSLDQNMLNAYLQVYQTAGANPMASQVINHRKVIEKIFKRAGDPTPDQSVRSEEDVQREQQQQQQQLAEQQQQEAGTQAGLDINRELARGVASTIGKDSGGGSPEGQL